MTRSLQISYIGVGVPCCISMRATGYRRVSAITAMAQARLPVQMLIERHWPYKGLEPG